MNSLDRKFRHSLWFRNRNMTVREFLDFAANEYGAFYVVKKPSRLQSDNLLDELHYDYVLKSDERGSYTLTDEQYNYYAVRYNERVKELFATDNDTMERLLLPLSA